MLAMALACQAPCFASEPLPVTQLNEQVMMVPAGPGGALETTIYKPDGAGPFPLLVINHGKGPDNPKLQGRDRFVHMAGAFVQRGYAVMVPMRTGFANSAGKYLEHGCNMTANGYTQANDVRDVIQFARSLAWIDPEQIVVAGQSYGGLATMALATQKIAGVRGVMNFAGGLRVHNDACDWQGALVRAFGEYGKRSKVASLWMYGANDSYFGPQLARRMFNAYSVGGGDGELVAYGAFKQDAHTLLASRDGVPVWLPQVERFLAQVGMPVREQYALAPAVPATNYAALDDVEALPFRATRARANAYKAFLRLQAPRAFAIAADGAWAWAEDGDDPASQALAACQSTSKQACQLYSVDNAVVWRGAGSTGQSE